ncbi:MAG: hypothetical protein ACI8S6_000067 [Myxococcota bacterium]|jgi:uncharacterized protein YjbI with pentapeptide repeats
MAKKRSGSLRRMFGPTNQTSFVEIPPDEAPLRKPWITKPEPTPVIQTPPEPEPKPSALPEPPTIDEDEIAWVVEGARAAPEPVKVEVQVEEEPEPEVEPEVEPEKPSLNLGAWWSPVVEEKKPSPALEVPEVVSLGITEAPTEVLSRSSALVTPRLTPLELLLQHVDAGTAVDRLIFSEVNLRGTKLRAADLRGAVLQQAELQGADLRGAELQGADLRRADLSGADLRGADLREVQLGMALLTNADMRFADLRGVLLVSIRDMTGADLRGADLSGVDVTESMHGARLDEQTYFRSGWSTVHLVAARACGVELEGLDRLPLEARQELSGTTEGLILSFASPLNFMDQYVLRGAICATLGPDAGCVIRVRIRERGGEVQITAEHGELTEIAEALHGRAWERAPDSEDERALNRRLFEVFPHARLINELSSLVDRLERIELNDPSGTIQWRPPVDPRTVLQHLLLKLFIPVELRWWLGCVPGGKQLVRELPGTQTAPELVVSAAIHSLERRDRIDAALFASLIEERRRREPEIRAVARLWGVEWYALRDQDDEDEA